MTTNDDVREYLDYYLNPKLDTDFAVMLNSPWGAGKTYFIKTYLKDREDKATSADPLQPLGHLYASLYGIRSTSEITDQFFAQAHPVLNSKTARLLGTVISHTINGFAGTAVNSGEENNSLIKKMVLNLDGRVLIFDDLERCAMPLVDVMGFINSFVEHEGLKVIVIGNEIDIPEGQKKDYARQKEKLIGKTLRVASDPQKVLDSFVDKLTLPMVAEVARQESEALLRTFKASGKQNFRSMRAVLSDFERLTTAVDARLQKSSTAMAKLLLFMMATGIEFRGGDLSGCQLGNLPGTQRYRMMSPTLNKAKSPEIDKVEKLEKTYPEVDWNDAVVPPASLAQLFETGIVDISAIDAHLCQHPLVVGHAKIPAWRRLWNLTDLSRTEYLKAKNELVRQLEARELIHPGIILHAAGIVIGAESFGDRMLGDDQDVVAYFSHYAGDLRSAGKLEPDIGVFTLGQPYCALGYGSEDTREFRDIYKAVWDATEKSFGDKMKDIAGSFIERISKDRNAYSSLHVYGVDEGNYADAPFLHYIAADAFAHVVIRDSAADGHLLASLNARYEMGRHNGALAAEYSWIKALQSSLNAIAARAEPPHRQILEQRLKYYFGKIEEAVEASKDAAAAAPDKEVNSPLTKSFLSDSMRP